MLKWLKKFRNKDRFEVANHFNKAATLATTAGVGYAINGKSGAILSLSLFFLKHYLGSQSASNSESLSAQQTRKAAIGSLNPNGRLNRKLSALAKQAGISTDVEILLLSSEETGSLATVHTSNPPVLTLNEAFASTASDDEILDVIAHELYHVSQEHTVNTLPFSKASSYVAKYNAALGTVISLVTQDPLPAIAGLVNIPINKALAAQIKKNQEYSADHFATLLRPAKSVFSTMKSIFYSTNIRSLAAHYLEDLHENMPFLFRGNPANPRIPSSLMSLALKANTLFYGTHPDHYQRLTRLAERVRKEDPDFVDDLPKSSDPVVLCPNHSGFSTVASQTAARSCLEEASMALHGHRNVQLEFKDCGMPSNSIFEIELPREIIISGGISMDDILGSDIKIGTPDSAAHGQNFPPIPDEILSQMPPEIRRIFETGGAIGGSVIIIDPMRPKGSSFRKDSGQNLLCPDVYALN